MPKILLVDDEPNIRFTVSEFLRREGYEPVPAADYDSALASFEAGGFDAAVVDIVLPRKSGLLVLEELRRRAPDLPIVMMTGEPNISILPEIVRAGAYDFLTKPVTKDVLLRAVSRAVDRKRLSDEKRRLEAELVRRAEELEATVETRTAESVEARNFLKAVVDSPVDYALVVMDSDCRVTLFNRGAELMFRQTAAEVRGRPARELIGEGADAEVAALAARAAQESRGETEIAARRADGTSFVACLTITPVLAADGRLLGQLAVVKDMTADRERAEEMNRMRDRLAQSEKIAALGRMAAQVAHEVRNPLTGLRLYAMHLRSKLGDRFTPEELALCDKILLNIDHLSNTTEQILNVARPINLALAPRRAAPLIVDVLQLLDSQLKAVHVEVKLDVDRAAPPALIDEASMRSALVNLLLNAIQAMPSGGTLSLGARAAGDSLVIEIADTGSGMTPEQLAQVFEPFYTTKSKGLGLGMPYAKRVIEEHRGSIRLESEPGAGTKVEIKLPLTEENTDAGQRVDPDR
jgi:PAS domain S-box-containing protein